MRVAVHTASSRGQAAVFPSSGIDGAVESGSIEGRCRVTIQSPLVQAATLLVQAATLCDTIFVIENFFDL